MTAGHRDSSRTSRRKLDKYGTFLAVLEPVAGVRAALYARN